MILPDLLQKLQWPADQLQSKGVLGWARDGGPAAPMQSASVVVSPRAVRCRLVGVVAGDLSTHFEAEWGLDQTLAPTLRRFVYAGEAQPLDDVRAVERFVSLVQMLNARPAFQFMGTLRPSVLPVPARP